MMSNYVIDVREFLILAHTWFAFDLPSKFGLNSGVTYKHKMLHRISLEQTCWLSGRAQARPDKH
jgi:hypothetical protein